MQVRVGDRIVLVGTAHVSPKSVAEVTEVISAERPTTVAIELDARRKEVLLDKQRWEKLPLQQLIRGRNAYFFLAQAYLASIQRRLGERFGVEPGAEMVAAIEATAAVGATELLADRDISITLQKAWRQMRLREKMRLLWEMIQMMVPLEEGTEEEIDLDALMEQDVLSMMMEELGTVAPTIAKVLIAERDIYLARHIHEAAKEGTVVAIVGAGHLQGIQKALERLAANEILPTLAELDVVPPKGFPWAKAIGYGTMVAMVVLILYRFYVASVEGTMDKTLADAQVAFFWWIVIHAICCAIATAAARGHPLSVAAGAFSSPFTALHPAVAAGWVAGGVEIWVRKPTNADLLELFRATTTEGFFKNAVIRILLVTALANVGSSIGTFLSLPFIVRFGLG